MKTNSGTCGELHLMFFIMIPIKLRAYDELCFACFRLPSWWTTCGPELWITHVDHKIMKRMIDVIMLNLWTMFHASEQPASASQRAVILKQRLRAPECLQCRRSWGSRQARRNMNAHSTCVVKHVSSSVSLRGASRSSRPALLADASPDHRNQRLPRMTTCTYISLQIRPWNITRRGGSRYLYIITRTYYITPLHYW